MFQSHLRLLNTLFAQACFGDTRSNKQLYKFISIIEQFVDKKIDFLLNGINGTKMNNKNKAMFKFIPIIDQSMDKK